MPIFDFDSSARYDSWDLRGMVANAANLRFGTNPTYTVDDFLEMYPQFGGLTELSEDVIQVFVNLASSCLSYARWADSWRVAMGWFVAHYCTLYLQASVPAGSGAKAVVGAAMARGVQVSKSAADVSVGYQQFTTGWEQWGVWNLTSYGQQLIQIASLMGLGGMYVW